MNTEQLRRAMVANHRAGLPDMSVGLDGPDYWHAETVATDATAARSIVDAAASVTDVT